MDRGASTIIATIADDAAGWRLDRALAATLPTISRERLKALISSGQVRDAEGGAERDPASKAKTGTAYTITIPTPATAHHEPQASPPEIVLEQEHLKVVNKTEGQVGNQAGG